MPFGNTPVSWKFLLICRPSRIMLRANVLPRVRVGFEGSTGTLAVSAIDVERIPEWETGSAGECTGHILMPFQGCCDPATRRAGRLTSPPRIRCEQRQLRRPRRIQIGSANVVGWTGNRQGAQAGRSSRIVRNPRAQCVSLPGHSCGSSGSCESGNPLSSLFSPLVATT